MTCILRRRLVQSATPSQVPQGSGSCEFFLAGLERGCNLRLVCDVRLS